MKQDTAQTIAELEQTDLGKRLLATEKVLQLIDNDSLPYLKKVVSRAVFSAKAIDNVETFEVCEGNDELREQLRKSSTLSAYPAMNLTGIPQATLYYSRDINVNETMLLSSYFPQLLAMVYAAIGLNTTPCSSLDDRQMDQILQPESSVS